MKHTPELAMRIGHPPFIELVDSGLTSNCIDAQECIAKKLLVEIEGQLEQLHMVHGIAVKTKGRVQVKLKCGGY